MLPPTLSFATIDALFEVERHVLEALTGAGSAQHRCEVLSAAPDLTPEERRRLEDLARKLDSISADVAKAFLDLGPLLAAASEARELAETCFGPNGEEPPF